MRRTLWGLCLVAGLALAPPVAEAQKEKPNPANEAAIAAGKDAIAAYQAELKTVRDAIAGIETASRQAHSYKVYATWLEGEIALAKQSFDDKHPKAAAPFEALGATAKQELEQARAYKDAQRTELSSQLASLPLDQKAAARPELEAIIQAESSQLNVAEQLAKDFDNTLQALGEGTPPYALFNARKPMHDQAAVAFAKATAAITASTAKLKAMTPPT